MSKIFLSSLYNTGLGNRVCFEFQFFKFRIKSLAIFVSEIHKEESQCY